MFSSHCLLGSVNCQFSTLRKKEVLVLNKDRIELAVQSLPNAKRVLFGEDFPSIASKQDDLSRSFAKNLGWASRPSKRRRSSQCLPPKGKDLLPVPNVNTKVPVQKTGVPFGPPNPRQKNRRTHSQVEGNNLQPSNSQHWVRLQDSVTLRTSSVLSTGYKFLPRESPRHIRRGGESPCQRRHSPCLLHERGLSQSSIRDFKEVWNLLARNRPEFSVKVRGNSYFKWRISLPLSPCFKEGTSWPLWIERTHTCRFLSTGSPHPGSSFQEVQQHTAMAVTLLELLPSNAPNTSAYENSRPPSLP